MSHYKSNLRDLEFNLFEFYKAQQFMGKGRFGEMDEASARVILCEVEKLSREEIAPSFEEGDRQPLVLENGEVTLPPAVGKAIKAFFEGEWHKLELTEEQGGYGATPSLRWATLELIVGANPTVAFYIFGTFIATIIDNLGTESQRKRYVKPILDNHWGGTMVLTEPEAGSDVGAARAKARQIEGDVWELEGVKRFITNGDFDTAENIVHLVLARPEGAPAGTKGLSMFIVPKFWVNEDGSLGERNGAYVTNIEHKMGIKGSATCELTLGENGKCRGLLVGEAHEGIKQMFNVIEHARMFVGLKSMSTLSTAYLNALSFAQERVQGPDMTSMMDKAAPKLPIIRHPDVRRMLMLQKAHAEGMRALVFYAASMQDNAAVSEGDEHKKFERLNDLVLPLIKGYCSEKVYEMLSLSLQTYGGSGYCQDYPIEQYIRDQKIDSLYEGTTHIQALDLFFRKIGRDQGATLQLISEQMRAFVEQKKGGDELTEERAFLAEGLENVQGMLIAMMGFMGTSMYLIGLNANRVLESLAETVIAWLLLEQAVVAQEKVGAAGPADKAFYQGKIASAKFFARNVLPTLASRRRIIEGANLDVMNMDDALF